MMVATTSKDSLDSGAKRLEKQSKWSSPPAFMKGLWRLVQPLRSASLNTFPKLPALYVRYFKDRRRFAELGGSAPFAELFPALFDRSYHSQTGGGQYFYQDVWALGKLLEFAPNEHHDIGSRLDGFVGQATTICPTVFWDIREPRIQLQNFHFRFGALPNLPLGDQSVSSISCLHVLEHLGLGRYGDDLDPDGTHKGLLELMRILAPGGRLLISLPIGPERVCFNAERVWNPAQPIRLLHELKLIEFRAVSDSEGFLENVAPEDLVDATNTCGLYAFERPGRS